MDLMALLDQFIAYIRKGKHLRYFILSLVALIVIVFLSSGNLFDKLIGLFSSVFGICLAVLLIALYFAPTIEARRRKKRNTAAVFVLNLFLGWTVIGWIVAVVWACTNDAPIPAASVVMIPPLLCSSCGRYSRGDAAFCIKCGTSLS
jgi:hypothetical protein